MQLAPSRANVELREIRREPHVVFAFPYRADLVEAMRAMPGRRFDWDEKEWSVPQHDLVAPYVADVLSRWPELVVHDDVRAWLRAVPSHWLGRVTTRRAGRTGEFVVQTLAGELPEGLTSLAVQAGERDATLPFTEEAAELLSDLTGARLDRAAAGCALRLRVGLTPPAAELIVEHTVEEARLSLEVLWDPDVGEAFKQLPGVERRSRTLPIDPWALESLEAFLRLHEVAVAATAIPVLADMRRDHDEAIEAVRRSRARTGEPLVPALRLGGELAPFQWAGVRYLLEARRAFLADEPGLGKTVQALATLEADDAFPAVVVCPASLRLVWEREAAHWLPHRTTTLLTGRGTIPPPADITILSYEAVAAQRENLARRRPQALVLDESHYCKNPRAKRTHAVRRLANALPPDALRLALSGTPVTNGAEEVVPQLRILGRLEDFGSGATLLKRFAGPGEEERLHWHLRRRCFVRRRKAEVLPQLPAKRQVVVPVALVNEQEYRLAERDVVAWLRSLPLDLRELDARVAATLRAERLAQLTALKRLAAKGKLAAAAAWIEDFRASGEALVVFAHHTEVQEDLLARFPDAGHLLGRDSQRAREETVRTFQDGTGPDLLICSTLAAGHGITLTRASNVAFLELEWTPAHHDQAEDRCHRIGQHDAVTAWYLLAAGTIDEQIAELLHSKRRIVEAVTDGHRREGGGLVDAVAAALREVAPRRHLRPVA
ncbi:MAG: SWI/SNF-related matrix-associated actin-dependent regulator of chromatin subfamily A-like protein 1 [Solirubrobacteraceae bacterium]|nr:SWI/SNF-related matrix-associated actin-dependent regulator of chromatin subfamily A-like protein 1 [Solirubrobacteraceae bacterium]